MPEEQLHAAEVFARELFRAAPAIQPPVPRLQVVAGLLVHKGLVLLQQRSPDGFMPGMWENAGGKVDAGEWPRPAVERELREELGIRGIAGTLINRGNLELWVPASISLYDIRHVSDIPRGAEGQNICLVDPRHAVKHMACAPSFYLFYKDIIEWATPERSSFNEETWPGVEALDTGGWLRYPWGSVGARPEGPCLH